jgi:putative drug exporter of the RND superfamily
MFFVLGQLVARRWPWVIAGWILVVVGLRLLAPAWDDVTYDGDLAYLPDQSPSVRGELLLERAFPERHAKSQFVVVLAREDGPLTSKDLHIGFDVARRLKNLHGATLLHSARRHQQQTDALGPAIMNDAEHKRRDLRVQELLADARLALDEAVEFDRSLTESRKHENSLESLPEIYWNRALLAHLTGDLATAKSDRQRALLFAPELADRVDTVLPEIARDLPILDVWTWRDEVFGRKLISKDKQARLIVVRIANEFLALRNQPLLQRLEAELAEVRAAHNRASLASDGVRLVGPLSGDIARDQAEVLDESNRMARPPHPSRPSRSGMPFANDSPEVTLTVSGSAAVGGDMLQSAKESIEDTELFTVILIVAILAFVYRAPLLVFIPLLSIVVALLASTSLVAILAAWSESLGPGGWWQFKIFTTTKIFIVVILYGAGTDYCLFLISRFREELEQSGSTEFATARALAGVGDALSASALTTIFGLSMMFFSDFGKLRFSGPVIGFCLAIGLLVCLTLTPALLHGCGRWVFWPRRGARGRSGTNQLAPESEEPGNVGPSTRAPMQKSDARRVSRLWAWLADAVVRRPGVVLVASLLVLLPLIPRGLASSERVTYDVLASLDASRPSRIGTTAMRRHFPVGESGPLTIVLHRPQADFHSPDGRQALTALTGELYQVDGVRQVRSLVDPLGEFPPGTRIGLTNRHAWRTWLARSHRQTNALFLAQTPEFPGDLTRLDVLLAYDPFSRESMEVLNRLDETLQTYCREAANTFGTARLPILVPRRRYAICAR